MPEHRPDGEKLLNRVFLIKAVLDISSYHRGGSLRPQSKSSPFAVRERIHLLGHNVCFLPNTAGKQLGLLEEGRFDLAESKRSKYSPCFRFQALPRSNLFGKNVSESLDSRKVQEALIPSFAFQGLLADGVLLRQRFSHVPDLPSGYELHCYLGSLLLNAFS